ncbi:hypothetical protein [Plebeiibacterium sediminum]|uniref:Phage protein n=1 Tax=Plebeiibacterium sediminum TaxID=2992112 RepID=A0AAE3SGF1_9BACT|nr:hypothetical protein [Plebeiobacterium sediminum]MCW3787233.1 hypothetical protein [Plebeiobacterium sediminum]
MKLQDYLPKNKDERFDTLSDPIAKRALYYFEEVYPVEYLSASFDDTLDNIIIEAVANYSFKSIQHVTNGGDTSVADEIGMQAVIEVIQEHITKLIK